VGGVGVLERAVEGDSATVRPDKPCLGRERCNTVARKAEVLDGGGEPRGGGPYVKEGSYSATRGANTGRQQSPGLNEAENPDKA